MQANLYATTFNNHNQIKNEYMNYVRNPHMNKVSQDLSYKTMAINKTSREPIHINSGSEYLYSQRLRLLQIQLKTHEIDINTYNIRVQELQISCYGSVCLPHDLFQLPSQLQTQIQPQPTTNDNSTTDSTSNNNETNETINEQLTEPTPKELLSMINNEGVKPTIEHNSTESDNESNDETNETNDETNETDDNKADDEIEEIDDNEHNTTESDNENNEHNSTESDNEVD